MLMDTDGCSRAMPTDLNSILNASEDLKFHSESYSTKNGDMGLVLTLFKNYLISKILRLQLNKLGEISFNIPYHEQNTC